MNETQLYTTTRTINLDHEQLLLLDGKPGTRIRVVHGGVWLTTEDAPGFRIAHASDQVTVSLGGRSLIASIGKTTVELIEPARGGRLRRSSPR